MFTNYGDYMNRRVNKLDCCCEKGEDGKDGKDGTDVRNGADLSCNDISNVRCIHFCEDIKIYSKDSSHNSIYIGQNDISDCSNHDLSENSISIGNNVTTAGKSVIIACSGDTINGTIGKSSVAIGIDISGGDKNVILGHNNKVYGENIALGYDISGGHFKTQKQPGDISGVNNNIILNVSGSSVSVPSAASVLDLNTPLGSDLSGTTQINPIRPCNNLGMMFPLYYNPFNFDASYGSPFNIPLNNPKRKEVTWVPYIIRPKWERNTTNNNNTSAQKMIQERAIVLGKMGENTSDNGGIYVFNKAGTTIQKITIDTTTSTAGGTSTTSSGTSTTSSGTSTTSSTATFDDFDIYKSIISTTNVVSSTSNTASSGNDYVISSIEHIKGDKDGGIVCGVENIKSNLQNAADMNFLGVKLDKVSEIFFDGEGKFAGYRQSS